MTPRTSLQTSLATITLDSRSPTAQLPLPVSHCPSPSARLFWPLSLCPSFSTWLSLPCCLCPATSLPLSLLPIQTTTKRQSHSTFFVRRSFVFLFACSLLCFFGSLAFYLLPRSLLSHAIICYSSTQLVACEKCAPALGSIDPRRRD